MNDTHEFQDSDGVKYDREFTKPNAAFDTVIDPFSEKDFSRKTHKKVTIGDMWDDSAEMSEKRIQKCGYDPVKKKAIEKYAKKCHGKIHPLSKED